MPRLNAIAYGLTRRLPKVISSRQHAITDYVSIGMFSLAGALFWRTNKRAAAAAVICGAAELALNLITDYPGGIAEIVSFPAHGKVDMGLAALTATMPDLLGFRRGRNFFLAHSVALTATTNLTQFSATANRSSVTPSSRRRS